MEEKIAWVSDTSALLSEEFINENQIHVLPIILIFENGAYRELVDISLPTFYEKLRDAKKIPTTSQPNLGESIDLYKGLKNLGYTCAIAVHPSSKLSNTYEGAITAAKQANFNVYPIDSKMISYPMMKLLQKGKEMEQSGYSAEEIVNTLNHMADESVLIGIPGNLTQLHKSGRVPGIAALIGNIIKLKLILSFENGFVRLKDKVRTYKRAKEYATNLLRKDLKKHLISEVAIVHCNNEQKAKVWKDELITEFPSINFIIYPLSAAIAIHAGEGTTGLSWIKS